MIFNALISNILRFSCVLATNLVNRLLFLKLQKYLKRNNRIMITRNCRNCILILVFLSLFTESRATVTIQVYSRSGKICLKTWMGKQLNYYISYDNKSILDISTIDLEL